jgi:hypothetical protein
LLLLYRYNSATKVRHDLRSKPQFSMGFTECVGTAYERKKIFVGRGFNHDKDAEKSPRLQLTDYRSGRRVTFPAQPAVAGD